MFGCLATCLMSCASAGTVSWQSGAKFMRATNLARYFLEPDPFLSQMTLLLLGTKLDGASSNERSYCCIQHPYQRSARYKKSAGKRLDIHKVSCKSRPSDKIRVAKLLRNCVLLLQAYSEKVGCQSQCLFWSCTSPGHGKLQLSEQHSLCQVCRQALRNLAEMLH